eukprot:12686817-Prorocentrum_lima.AAC.1
MEEAKLDLRIRGTTAPVLFADICVWHPVATRAGEVDGHTAQAAEASKHRRYPSGPGKPRLIPLAAETFGRLGAQALRFLGEMARHRHQLP